MKLSVNNPLKADVTEPDFRLGFIIWRYGNQRAATSPGSPKNIGRRRNPPTPNAPFISFNLKTASATRLRRAALHEARNGVSHSIASCALQLGHSCGFQRLFFDRAASFFPAGNALREVLHVGVAQSFCGLGARLVGSALGTAAI